MTTTGAMKAGHGSTAVPPYRWAKDMEGGTAVPTTTVPSMVKATPGVTLIMMITGITAVVLVISILL